MKQGGGRFCCLAFKDIWPKYKIFVILRVKLLAVPNYILNWIKGFF